ncbi:putative pentatricopeptide repeat-containing protein At1g64310 [Argentina anserina]|uniref:putative pentatricopeptide repeat-containing protein At1g64310 n=1 Tax=Argentina anserina TaxID=57926 RepID=UPI0021766967|nr:putative pentatricopeptide repeat-containing protein At1g64310 [Potentilla anserina]
MLFQFQLLCLELSKVYQSLSRTKQLHALIIRTHLSHDPFYATRLVRYYAASGALHYARKVFDASPSPSVYLWNSIIRAYAQAHRFEHASSLFNRMVRSETKPDNFTYACLIRACSDSYDINGLKLVHCGVTVSGLGLDSFCSSSLVSAYSKLGLVDEASRVFYVTPQPDLVMWNSMILSCGNFGFWDKGLELFSMMRRMEVVLDGYTFVGLLSGLKHSSLLSVGQGIHGLCLKCSLDYNDHVCSVLVSMYSRCRCMDSAHKVFSGLFEPDLVTWSSLITGYSQSGDYGKALSFFKYLNMEGNRADPILIASVLAAASQIANVGPGSEIHAYVLRRGLVSDVMISSALIAMYSKCGFMGMGTRVFEAMPEKNIVSYNTLILGLGLHGLAAEAFRMFNEILKNGLVPDEATFSALLSACCHSGLVKDGREIFRKMREEFGINARAEHYVHLVKLLGMEGSLHEAYNLISSLPEPVDSGIWGALLSGCDAYGDTELAEIIAQKLFESNSEKTSYRVMLSNIYAADGRWDDSKKVRDYITEGQLRKTTGLCWTKGFNGSA